MNLHVLTRLLLQPPDGLNADWRSGRFLAFRPVEAESKWRRRTSRALSWLRSDSSLQSVNMEVWTSGMSTLWLTRQEWSGGECEEPRSSGGAGSDTSCSDKNLTSEIWISFLLSSYRTVQTTADLNHRLTEGMGLRSSTVKSFQLQERREENSFFVSFGSKDV